VKELVVVLSGERAGRLIQKDNGNLQFRYDEGYAGPPVSHALPIQPEAHPHAVCVAVFGGLLLEGDGRATLARSLGISEGNDFRLLEEVGRDVAGAIALLEVDESMPTATRCPPTPPRRRRTSSSPSRRPSPAWSTTRRSACGWPPKADCAPPRCGASGPRRGSPTWWSTAMTVT
jgi:HipA-like protein